MTTGKSNGTARLYMQAIQRMQKKELDSFLLSSSLTLFFFTLKLLYMFWQDKAL